jgi:hypothetical protein
MGNAIEERSLLIRVFTALHRNFNINNGRAATGLNVDVKKVFCQFLVSYRGSNGEH